MAQLKSIFTLLLVFNFFVNLNAQENLKIKKDSTLSGLKFRSIGPAFMSGRIADIAIDPNNQNIWYVAVGSGRCVENLKCRYHLAAINRQ